MATPFNFLAAADPGLYAKQLALARQQALADSLLKQGMTPDNYAQTVGPGPYEHVVPYGIGQGVAKAGQMLASALLDKSLFKQQGKLAQEQMGALMGMFGGSPQSSPQISNTPPQSGGTPSPDLQSGLQPQSSPQVTQNAPSGMGGMLPTLPGRTPGQSGLQFLMAPESYWQGVNTANAPTDIVKNLQASGVDPMSPEGQKIMQGVLNKASILPPVRGYGGGYYMDPVTKALTYLPKIPEGGAPIDPNNPTQGIQMIPGAAQTAGTMASAVKGAEAGAQAPYQFHMVPTASGAMVPMSAAQLAGNHGQVTPNGPAPYQIPAPIPQTPLSPVNATAPTRDQALAQMQQMDNQGIKGSVTVGPDPWASIPKMPVPQGLGQTTFQRGIQEGAAQQASKLYQEYNTNADQANLRMAFNNQALDLVDKADTGPLAAQQTAVKQYLMKFVPGIKESDFANTPSANLALNKDLTNAALQRGKQLFGQRFTQGEVGIMLTRAAPSPEQTKTAIKFLLQSDNAQLGYQVNQARAFGKYMQMGGDPYRFPGWYTQHFPMTNAVEQVHMGTQPTGTIPLQSLIDEARRRGLAK